MPRYLKYRWNKQFFKTTKNQSDCKWKLKKHNEKSLRYLLLQNQKNLSDSTDWRPTSWEALW